MAMNPAFEAAIGRRLKKKKSDPGDALDKKQGIVDSAAEDAADAKAGNKTPNKRSNGIG